jgi:hypothetical protein
VFDSLPITNQNHSLLATLFAMLILVAVDQESLMPLLFAMHP